MNAGTLSIKHAAEASGLTAKTIRYYEQVGLVPRALRGNRAARTGGNRIYKPSDIERLRFVRNARLLGLRLSDIRELLAAADGRCPSDQPLYREMLQGHLRAIDDGIGRLRTLRKAIERLLAGAGAQTRGCTNAGCGCMDAPELEPRRLARAAPLGRARNGESGGP